jgi:hypothetical protein
MTHYRLILTKGCQKIDLTSRQVTALARTSTYSKLQTRPLIREDATKLQTQNSLKKISRRKKNWSRVPDGRLTPRRTGRLIVGRNVTLTLVVRHMTVLVIKLVLQPELHLIRHNLLYESRLKAP